MKPIALLFALLIVTWAFVHAPANAQPNEVPEKPAEVETPIKTEAPVEKIPPTGGAIVAPGTIKEEVRESKRQFKKSERQRAKKNQR